MSVACLTNVRISSGSKALIPMQLWSEDINGVRQNIGISGGSTVTFWVRDRLTEQVYIGPVDVVSTTTGSDWANGLVVASLTETDTAFTVKMDDAVAVVNIDDTLAQTNLDYFRGGVELVPGT